MTLSALLRGVTVTKLFQTVYGKTVVTQELEIREVRYDSRAVVPGDLFVAIRGNAVDGHRFINDAIHRGAVAVVLDDDAAIHDSLCLHTGTAKVVVPDTRSALAVIAANLHGNPARRLTLVGVTGTNGKTTTTHLVRSVLEAAGMRTGLVGTIGVAVGDEVRPATHTTPESLELHGLLASMVTAGCTAAVMEVSSHALVQHRVAGVPFRVGVFTNLTPDHLDFHQTMESYAEAKQVLFRGLGAGTHAVINADDPHAETMIEGSAAQVLRYAIDHKADVRARSIRLGVRGTAFELAAGGASTVVRSRLIGTFNVQNILAAWTTGIALGIPGEIIQQGIASSGPVRGRFEQISSPKGWTAIVDYAHTPDALAHCLRTIRELLPQDGGRIITVFGCGGDRDRTKRPAMGRIAADASDITIITSDNPRSEEPDAIIAEIAAGVTPGRTVHRETDRRRAIARALELARRGDVVLIAGKGHETYQVVGTSRKHFDDREEVERTIGITA